MRLYKGRLAGLASEMLSCGLGRSWPVLQQFPGYSYTRSSSSRLFPVQIGQMDGIRYHRCRPSSVLLVMSAVRTVQAHSGKSSFGLMYILIDRLRQAAVSNNFSSIQRRILNRSRRLLGLQPIPRLHARRGVFHPGSWVAPSPC